MRPLFISICQPRVKVSVIGIRILADGRERAENLVLLTRLDCVRKPIARVRYHPGIAPDGFTIRFRRRTVVATSTE